MLFSLFSLRMVVSRPVPPVRVQGRSSLFLRPSRSW
nr:MAG TPA: hypothetical protein [Caudoviricetes sp.]